MLLPENTGLLCAGEETSSVLEFFRGAFQTLFEFPEAAARLLADLRIRGGRRRSKEGVEERTDALRALPKLRVQPFRRRGDVRKGAVPLRRLLQKERFGLFEPLGTLYLLEEPLVSGLPFLNGLS